MSRHIKPRSEFFKSRSFVRICHHAPTALLGILVTALIVLVAGYGASRTSEFQWFLLRASLRCLFPQVQWITTRERADWLEDRHRPPPVLLDVRTVEESKVSPSTGRGVSIRGLPRKWVCPVRQEMFRSLRIAWWLSLRRIYHALACGPFHIRAKSGGLHFPVGESASPTCKRWRACVARASLQQILGTPLG